MSLFGHPPVNYALCGCWFTVPNSHYKHYLPQVELSSHTTILANTSRTVLQQTFDNPLNRVLEEVSYTFPLYDGVSIAGFRCTVAGCTMVAEVKERNQAQVVYQEAISKGQTAGLFEQTLDASDVFTTSIGNVPVGEKILVEITYLGELKNDAETDGARFTIPTQIAPRYGQISLGVGQSPQASAPKGMKITVDVELEAGNSIRGIQSPTHPIAVTMGKTSTMSEDDDTFENNLGSLTLALGSTELDTDFVLIVLAKGQDTPVALLESHPTLPDQLALMTTLVPKFNIPNDNPEIVFVVDRSGSMTHKMQLVIEALKVFLKSLPISVKFNICSFGSHHSFLFEKSKTYDAASLQAAMRHIDPQSFQANYGGTEMLQPVQEVLKRRYKDLSLEVLLLTDGEVWDQEALFSAVNKASQQRARFFTLGVGSSASTALVEGVARAGKGFSLMVNDSERIDKRIVRMLKGALSPHIQYRLEVKYEPPSDSNEGGFEIVESFEKSMEIIAQESSVTSTTKTANEQKEKKKKILLFNTSAKDEPTNPTAGRYDKLPEVSVPNILQVPHIIPDLYPHSRSTVYLLISPGSHAGTPVSVVLRGASEHGDLELEIPIQRIGKGDTIHQLAAKKAMQELEEGRGWLTEALTTNNNTLKSQNEGIWDLIVEREAVRLGTTFQVGGKFCSFVATHQGEHGTEPKDTGHPNTLLQDYHSGFTKLEPQKKRRLPMAPRQFQTQTHLGSAKKSVPSTPFGVQPSDVSSTSSVAFGSSRSPVSGSLFGSARANTVSNNGNLPGGGLFGASQPTCPSNASYATTSATDTVTQDTSRPQDQQAQRTSLFGSSNAFSGVPYHAAPPTPFRQSAPLQTAQLQSNSLFHVTPVQIQHVQRKSLFSSSKTSPGALFGAVQQAPFGQSPQFQTAPSQSDSLSHVTPVQSQQGKGYNLDLSTAEQADVQANFDFDSFLETGKSNVTPDTFSSDNVHHSIATSGVQVDSPPQFPAMTPPNHNRWKADTANPFATVFEDYANLSALTKMQKLIGLQSFSGHWTIDHDLCAIISHTAVRDFSDDYPLRAVFARHTDLEDHNGDNKMLESDEMNDSVIATIMAIAWLEAVMAEEKDVWEMVVGKAREWLKGQVSKSQDIDSLVERVQGSWKI